MAEPGSVKPLLLKPSPDPDHPESSASPVRLKKSQGHRPRAYTGWNEEEAKKFFEGIKVFGRDHQKLSNHIGSKTYDQVRHFYYRLIKKMNTLLQPLGRQVNKSDKHEVRDAILFWYEFFKPKGKLTGAPVPGGEEANKLASALLEYLQTRPANPSKFPPLPLPSSRHKTLLPKAQSERLNSVIKQLGQQSTPSSSPTLQTPDQSSSAQPLASATETTTAAGERTTTTATLPQPPPPKRVTLQLIPKETTIADQITRSGYNPLLQLTYSSKKPISYIIQHMMKKWIQEVDGVQVPVATGPIRLYPVPPMDHYSWGIESDDVSSASIYQLLSCDGVMRLLYCWLEEKENTSATSTSTSTSTTAPFLPSSNSPKPKTKPKTKTSGRARLETRITPSSPLLLLKKEKDEPHLSSLSLPAPLLSPILSRPRSPSLSAQSPTSPSRFFATTPKKSPTPLLTAGSPSNLLNFASPAAVSPKFKVPDTPNILSLSFLDEASRDGFQAAENDEKECREFYKEFDAASHDEDSGFAKFFRSVEEESSPIRRRLDFSHFPSMLDTSPAPNNNKRRLSDVVGSGREDSEDGDNLFSVLTTATKRKKLSFGGGQAAATEPKPTTSSVNVSLDSLLEETNSNSCFNSYWGMTETSNG